MLKAFILGLQFLTRLPINIRIDFNKNNLSKTPIFFPIIGMIIGGISGGIYYLLSFLNNDIAALGAVLSLVLVTGGLHIDGLSDTTDGFFSSRPREKILEIMKDSRVGAFGVISIVFDIMFKYVLLKNMTVQMAVPALVLSCAIGRTMITMLFSFGKSARPGGMGEIFMNKNSKIYFVFTLVILIMFGVFIGKYAFVVAFLSAIIFSLCFMKYSYKVIGGVTGDVYGANCELSEIVSLIAFLVVMRWI
jgi:adenosylcobinamide-GDP ribazoletransferase